MCIRDRLSIGLELLGKKPAITTEIDKSSINNYEPKNKIVMFPTNGVGFGHFTRMLAIAKRMKKLDPKLEIIFFTTMPTLHLLKPYGIASHHISGPKYFKNLETNEWNSLLEEELTLCIDTHKPKLFMFDGAFPYRGMLRGINNHPMQKIWIRRSGGVKDRAESGRNHCNYECYQYFSLHQCWCEGGFAVLEHGQGNGVMRKVVGQLLRDMACKTT